MNKHLFLALLISLGFKYVVAQFNFFGNVFGGQQQQHQQQQRPGTSQWTAYSESVPCSQYMCPQTLDCVAKPTDCPCPNFEDVKCIIFDSRGEGTVVCTRGQQDCLEVERLMKKGTQQGRNK